MGLSRSTFYDRPRATLQAGELLKRIVAICDEFECYGYRRVGAALRHQGVVVNNKRLRRLMREHGLGLPRFRGHRRCFPARCPAMPKTRPPYAPEFRRQMIDLVRAGRDPTELAREFEPSSQAIRNWVAQADREEGRREAKPPAALPAALPAAERDELARLRRENKQLRLERDILSRATAWFARETGVIPSGSSNS